MNLSKAQFLVTTLVLLCTSSLPVLDIIVWQDNCRLLSSRMKPISFDSLSYLVIAVAAVFVLFTGWQVVRDISRYGFVPEDEQRSKGIKDFRTGTFHLVLSFMSTIFIGVLGLVSLHQSGEFGGNGTASCYCRLSPFHQKHLQSCHGSSCR